MKISDVLANAFAMPLTSPAFQRGPYRFSRREFLVITYRTDPELWGFPKKLASPVFEVEIDTLVGTLDYGKVRVAKATMGFKHRTVDTGIVLKSLAAPNFLLKIIPHVDGTTRLRRSRTCLC